MTVYDVFPFSNEVDVLLLRMGILDPYVDYFVIGEATTTFSGLAKDLLFEKYRPLFAKWEHKIVHHVVSEVTEGSTFDRDRFQKDQLRVPLDALCKPDDVVLFSDVDEIPNPKHLAEACAIAASGRMAHFAQDQFYYYLNLREMSGKLLSITGDYPWVLRRRWLGSRACTYSYLQAFTMTELRDPVHKRLGKRISDGGWHFTYCGGEPGDHSVEARVRRKIQDFAHQELVSESLLSDLGNRISAKQDVFLRRGAKLRPVPVDERFPDYLRENLANFAHMLLVTPSTNGA